MILWKQEEKKKEIERSYFNFRPGTACMDLQQDLSKKWWIKNKQSPAGIQEEEWRGFAQRTLCLNYGVTETDKTSRCCLTLVPRGKLLCQEAQRVFYSFFWKKWVQAAGFWTARGSHCRSACAKFHQLFVRKKVGGVCSTHCHSKRQFLSHKKPKLKEF